ncbi:Hypothetical protein POVR2_LOCUS42 [uncultured virus]|nr:Hypothetical protein POVR2_LOCUS42 [uncultured virus]
MKRAESILAELSKVDQYAHLLLSRGLEGGEEAMLTYLCSAELPTEVKLNVNWEDAGYQVHLLMCTIITDNVSLYIDQYKKYLEWVKSQLDDPQFHWCSEGTDSYGASSGGIISQYARYLESSIPEKLQKLRTEAPIEDEVQYPIKLAESTQSTNEHKLVKIASAIATMKRPAPGDEHSAKFGTVSAIEHSVLYQEMRIVSEAEREHMVRQFMPCLSPYMDSILHDTIVKNVCEGVKNPRLILSSMLRYEIVLRDMMEEADLSRMAELYAIGHRTCKKFDIIEDYGEDLCDILTTERMRMRFIEMKYSLKTETTRLRLSVARHEFISSEHKALLARGARDGFDYRELQLAVVGAIDKYTCNVASMSAELELIRSIDVLSRNIAVGIKNCLKSIGTDRIEIPNLVD